MAASPDFVFAWESGSSIAGEECSKLARLVLPASVRPTVPIRSSPFAKNGNEGKGMFAPLVVLTRNIIGKKRLNQLRGKSIALHSQVITEFCKAIGADGKQRQGLIQLAQKNGERLGLLACQEQFPLFLCSSSGAYRVRDVNCHYHS